MELFIAEDILSMYAKEWSLGLGKAEDKKAVEKEVKRVREEEVRQKLLKVASVG